jgi:hypothetical protein
VTGVALAEFDELFDELEPGVPEVAPALEDLLELADLAAAFARAGSLPVTSWSRIPPELARNKDVAIATTRVRICLIRRLRARSRSATDRLVADLPVTRGGGLRAAGTGRASAESFGGVMISSVLIWGLRADSAPDLAKP